MFHLCVKATRPLKTFYLFQAHALTAGFAKVSIQQDTTFVFFYFVTAQPPCRTTNGLNAFYTPSSVPESTQAAVERCSHVYQDKRFADYFCDQYLVKTPCDPAIYGMEELWLSSWWSGVASRLQCGHAATSQPQESFHSKMKRDLKSQGTLRDHQSVVKMLERCCQLRLGLSPCEFCVLTYIGAMHFADCCSGSSCPLQEILLCDKHKPIRTRNCRPIFQNCHLRWSEPLPSENTERPMTLMGHVSFAPNEPDVWMRPGCIVCLETNLKRGPVFSRNLNPS